MSETIERVIPESLKNTLYVRAFGLLKVPLILYVGPVVEEMSDESCAIRIPLNWRTKNHLGSMYFGALCTGADIASGMIAMRLIQKSDQKISLVFKDFKADFLKRAEGDTVFSCRQGKELQSLVEKASVSGERVEMPVEVVATVPSKMGSEAVARFLLTISLKRRQ